MIFDVTTLDSRPTPTPPFALTAPAAGRPAGWYEDPCQVHHLRYYDGASWTDHVTHFGPSPCDRCNRRH